MTGHQGGDLDVALKHMACSQHTLLEQIEPIGGIHACTDVTGFGLLGIWARCSRTPQDSQFSWTVLPSRPTRSTGPVRTRYLQHSGPLQPDKPGAGWTIGSAATAPSAALLELLVDPQTCGPLLLACSSEAADGAHSERPLASDRQRNSRAWLRSVACGSQRKPACFSLRLQRFELALHGLRRPTAGQPELLRQIRSPCSRCLQIIPCPPHGAEGEGIRPIAVPSDR